jgi:zinc transport system ATP-binding protein
MTAEPLVEARGVVHRYGADLALDGVDLAIADGDRLAIVGPNGGGKSTLVRLLLGLARPTGGEIVWRVARRRRRLAYVPQFPSFDRDFPLRVDEMVRLGRLRGRRPLSRWTAQDLATVERLLAELELDKLRHAYLSELSGGEMKRALVARALAGEPDFLVLDEPTASLDEASRTRLWQQIAQLPPTAVVLLVTHDLAPHTFRPNRAVLVDRRLEALPVAGLHGEAAICGHLHG